MQIEFSKLIFWFVFLLVLGVTIFACALMWKTGDTSPLAYIIPAIFTAFTTVIAFYYWKAKNENKIKLMKRLGLEIEKDDIER